MLICNLSLQLSFFVKFTQIFSQHWNMQTGHEWYENVRNSVLNTPEWITLAKKQGYYVFHSQQPVTKIISVKKNDLKIMVTCILVMWVSKYAESFIRQSCITHMAQQVEFDTWNPFSMLKITKSNLNFSRWWNVAIWIWVVWKCVELCPLSSRI